MPDIKIKTIQENNNNMKLRKLYDYEKSEGLEDYSKGGCPHCKKGLLNVSLDHSFALTIDRNILGAFKDIHEFEFDVIECNRCSFINIEQVCQPETKNITF